VGSGLLRDLVEKVAGGRAGEHDLGEMRHIGAVMRQASQCGLGHTAPNHVLTVLDKFPDVFRRRLRAADFAPSFDLDDALAEARTIAGRGGTGAHPEGEA
jgi:[NiFe] hydrogenase diaphorase moiety large subunit